MLDQDRREIKIKEGQWIEDMEKNHFLNSAEASDEKERNQQYEYDQYSNNWSETDFTDMVSSLSQFINENDHHPHHTSSSSSTMVQSSPSLIFSSSDLKQEPPPHQPLQDPQGNFII